MKNVYSDLIMLLPDKIDDGLDRFEEFLKKEYKISSKEAIKAKYSANEILLNWLEQHPGAQVSCTVDKHGKKLSIALQLYGVNVESNPMRPDDMGESADMAGMILANLGVGWMHQFSDGANIVSTTIVLKQKNMLTSVAIAVVAAVVCSFILSFVPDSVSDGVMDYGVTPLFEAFLRLLSVVVGPLMFLSVVEGVMSLGDPAQLGTIGKKLGLHWIRGIIAGIVVAFVLTLVFFGIRIEKSSLGGDAVSDIINLVLNIIPPNIIEPFSTGNTLQIIFMAMIVGGVMLGLGKRISKIKQIVEQLNIIVQQVLTGIVRFLPAFIFLSILRVGASDQLPNLMEYVKMLAVFVVASVICCFAEILSVSIKIKMSVIKILKIVASSGLIAFSTSSSAAAFSECNDNLVKRFKVKKELVNFGFPMGVVVYMPGLVIWMVFLALVCMKNCNVPITAGGLVVLAIVVIFLSVATPPVPGAGLSCYTMLFSQLGIPLEMLLIASILEFVVDAVSTAVDIVNNQMKVVAVAKELDMIEKN